MLNEAEGRRSKTGAMAGSNGEVNKDEVGKLDRGEGQDNKMVVGGNRGNAVSRG